jgi:hypothetical protein
MTQHPPNMRDPHVASYRERMLHRPPARERSEKPRSELTLLALNAIIVILAVTAFTLAAFFHKSGW